MTTETNGKEKPQFILIMGGVCSGKTTFRKEKYSDGYIIIDAGEIFIELSKGEYFDFPSHLEDEMNKIGLAKCRNVINKRENIVTEIIGTEYEAVQEILDLMHKVGFETKIEYLECSMDEAWKRNVNRSADDISAHYCEPYHVKWLKQAVSEFLNRPQWEQANIISIEDQIYDEDVEDYILGRGNLSEKKKKEIERLLNRHDRLH